MSICHIDFAAKNAADIGLVHTMAESSFKHRLQPDSEKRIIICLDQPAVTLLKQLL